VEEACSVEVALKTNKEEDYLEVEAVVGAFLEREVLNNSKIKMEVVIRISKI
jgi:hypothetical protein